MKNYMETQQVDVPRSIPIIGSVACEDALLDLYEDQTSKMIWGSLLFINIIINPWCQRLLPFAQ